MGEAKKNIDDVLSYHYKEMARISNIADSHIQGVFGDFKLLMAVGGMLSWKPIHDALNLGESNGTQSLFYGFVAILLFLSIVGIMNLQRQLILFFSLEQVKYYESEIRSLLCSKDSLTFRTAENWRTSAFRKQVLVSLIFNIHFYTGQYGSMRYNCRDIPQCRPFGMLEPCGWKLSCVVLSIHNSP